MAKEATVSFELKSTKQFFYKLAAIFMSVVVLLTIFVYFYMQQPQFDELSKNSLLSGNHTSIYESGTFYNQLPTPVLTRAVEKIRFLPSLSF